ncbi:exodeoxyribonuclease V subunit beta [Wielerella bovis]
MSTTLNPLNIPISGTNLIEASAGTGKTYNIAALFTRLILLEQYDVDKILVVTFTKAATAELKTRLRARLDDALRVLKKVPQAQMQPEKLREQCGSDNFLYHLLHQAVQQEPNQARLQLRLKAAISNFDNAAIYTIHGFCQRVLQDFAFYCQVPFNIELDEDNTERSPIAAQDFWRNHVANHAERADLVYRHRATPQQQAAQLSHYIARPYLQFRQPENAESSLKNVQTEYRRAWTIVAANTAAFQAAFEQLLPDLKYYDAEKYQIKFAYLAELAEKYPQNPPPAKLIWDTFKTETTDKETKKKYDANAFSPDLLAVRTRSKRVLNETALATLLQLGDLIECSLKHTDAEQAALVQLAYDLAKYLREHNELDKKHNPTRRFDDLLLDVFHALQSHHEHAAALAAAMAKNWRIALIDEFQDTDPLQYAIFRTAFAHTAQEGSLKPTLFMVGDPKQAIYSFRGADIFAYLQAAQDADRHYTLAQNHRSHAKLINSIGAWFARPLPFVLPHIDYTPVTAARQESKLPKGNAAVRVTWLNDPDFAPANSRVKSESAEILGKRAAQWCAQEIAQMVQLAAAGRFRLHQKDGTAKPLHAGQIAVLVRARKDGASIQRELKKHGVQSVLLSRDSIFGEEEAQAIYALLAFFIAPQRLQSLIYVLSGCLFGYTAAEIAQLNENEHALTAWADSAARSLQVWHTHGIYAALQQFFAEHQTETRLLAQGNDRTLTNLHQIMELLADEDENGRTPAALHQWLGECIQAAQNGDEASGNRILRLESDENLVKIVTMHASKGLQYPIVYCPFVWKGRDSSADWHIVHHENGATELVHQSQMQPSDQEQVANEYLSEDLRLLYVALTRAEEQLNVYMASYQDSKHSAFAYLLNAQDTARQPENYRQVWQDFVNAQNRDETDFVLNTHFAPNHVIADRQPENVATTQEQTPPHYAAAHYPPRKYHFTAHTSFTALSRQTERAAAQHTDDTLLPALDIAEQNIPINNDRQPENSAKDNIAAFPQGAATGVCLHEILEKYRFAYPTESQRETIATILSKHGFVAEEWLPAVERMLDDTRHTPLMPHTSLHTIPEHKLLNELGFLFHTQDFRLPDIQQWFAKQSGLPENIVQAAQHLNFRDVRGFVNGFIDLLAQNERGDVFVVDYKSNYLGDTSAAYTPDAMNAAIAEHHYYLQALIYAVATARYLRSRHMQPETIHVRYLFLRGLDGISANGVWAWDIPVQYLQKLL